MKFEDSLRLYLRIDQLLRVDLAVLTSGDEVGKM
jgi:hypothetical protein